MTPVHWSGLLTTAEAAALAGVKPGTIRRWRSIGYLEAQGLDERGWPMHSAEAVRMAEAWARESGLASATHADPRRLRGRTRATAKAPVPPACELADAVGLFLDAHMPLAAAAYAMAG